MVRLKTRYILFEILYPPIEYQDVHAPYTLAIHQSSPQFITPKLLLSKLRLAIEEFFGNYGTGTTGSNLILKYFSNMTSSGIIRCSRDYYRIVCAALSLIHRIDSTDVIIRVVKVSGTIKKSEVFAVKRNHSLILKMNDTVSDDNDLVNITDNDNDNDI